MAIEQSKPANESNKTKPPVPTAAELLARLPDIPHTTLGGKTPPDSLSVPYVPKRPEVKKGSN